MVMMLAPHKAVVPAPAAKDEDTPAAKTDEEAPAEAADEAATGA
jgi:hypothetical protein